MFQTQFQSQYPDPRFNEYGDYGTRQYPFQANENPDSSTGDSDKQFSAFEQSLRMNFIRKVFSITAAQVLITGLFTHFFASHTWIFRVNSHFQWLASLSGFVAFIISLALGFSSTLSKKVPLNYYLLGIFTLAQSYCIGMIAGEYDIESVVTAMYLTAAVVGALAIYAIRSSKEINYYGGLLVLLSLGSGVFSFMNIFTGFGFFDSLLCFGGCVMSGIYFIYDVKLLMGRDRLKLTLDDYIKGAMHLYLDVVRVFINILQIIGTKVEEKKEEEKENERRRARARW